MDHRLKGDGDSAWTGGGRGQGIQCSGLRVADAWLGMKSVHGERPTHSDCVTLFSVVIRYLTMGPKEGKGGRFLWVTGASS